MSPRLGLVTGFIVCHYCGTEERSVQRSRVLYGLTTTLPTTILRPLFQEWVSESGQARFVKRRGMPGSCEWII